MKDLFLFLSIYIVFINICGFVVTIIDKMRARKKEYRVPESTLFFVSIFGGSVGTYIAMILMHHKTLKKKFMIGIPFIIFAQFVVLLIILYFLIK